MEFDKQLQQLLKEPERFVSETERNKYMEYILNCSDNYKSIRDIIIHSFPYFPLNYELIKKQVDKLKNIDEYLYFLEKLPLPIAQETLYLYLNKYDLFDLLEKSFSKVEIQNDNKQFKLLLLGNIYKKCFSNINIDPNDFDKLIKILKNNYVIAEKYYVYFFDLLFFEKSRYQVGSELFLKLDKLICLLAKNMSAFVSRGLLVFEDIEKINDNSKNRISEFIALSIIIQEIDEEVNNQEIIIKIIKIFKDLLLKYDCYYFNTSIFTNPFPSEFHYLIAGLYLYLENSFDCFWSTLESFMFLPNKIRFNVENDIDLMSKINCLLSIGLVIIDSEEDKEKFLHINKLWNYTNFLYYFLEKSALSQFLEKMITHLWCRLSLINTKEFPIDKLLEMLFDLPSKLQIQCIKMSDVNKSNIKEKIKNSKYMNRILQTNEFVKKVYGENKSMKFGNSLYNNEWNKATCD